MNLTAKILGFFTIIICLVNTAQAADYGISGSVGSTGISLHTSFSLQQDINGRVGFNYFSYSTHSNTSDLNYDLKIKLKTIDALVDWYPMANTFRITGGIVFNGNNANATGKASSNTYTLNGNTYLATQAGTLNGKIDFNRFSPYLGVGWGNSLNNLNSSGLSADLGILFQSSAKTQLTNNGCTLDAALCSQLANDVAAEQAKLNDKANKLKLYPVIRLGINYRY